MRWSDAAKRDPLWLYAGKIYREHDDWVGLALNMDDDRHILHDCTWPLPLPDNSVDRYQSEDVFEHIERDSIVTVLNEIHRVLTPGGLFRWSMPDYWCDVLRGRTQFDSIGRPIFDPGGGGRLENGKVVGGGHVWFPGYQSVGLLMDESKFTEFSFLHYYVNSEIYVTEPIDYSLGHIQRVPDHDPRVQDPWRPMSIVVDARK